MDVVGAGSGVGGLALARGLVRDGHRVRVMERSPADEGGGAAVTIFSNGAAALTSLGVTLEGVGGRIDEMAFCLSDGSRLMHFDLRVMERHFGHAVRTVPRRQLISRLAQGLPDGTVSYGRDIESVRIESELVTTTLASGDEVTSEIVVGADGYRSAVRRSVLDATPAIDTGWATWQGLTHVVPDLAEGTCGHYLVGDAGFVGLMPAGSGLLQSWFDVPWSPEHPSVDSPVTWLRNRFSHYAAPVPALLDAISDDAIGLYPHVVHHIPDQWGAGPTTLLGDAAHAFPPSQAQGANQAFEDAWVLRRALTLDGDRVELLRRYERCRAHRVRLVSRMAASERTNKPPSALLRAVTRMTPTALTSRFYVTLLRRFSSVLSGDEP